MGNSLRHQLDLLLTVLFPRVGVFQGPCCNPLPLLTLADVVMIWVVAVHLGPCQGVEDSPHVGEGLAGEVPFTDLAHIQPKLLQASPHQVAVCGRHGLSPVSLQEHPL